MQITGRYFLNTLNTSAKCTRNRGCAFLYDNNADDHGYNYDCNDCVENPHNTVVRRLLLGTGKYHTDRCGSIVFLIDRCIVSVVDGSIDRYIGTEEIFTVFQYDFRDFFSGRTSKNTISIGIQGGGHDSFVSVKEGDVHSGFCFNCIDKIFRLRDVVASLPDVTVG